MESQGLFDGRCADLMQLQFNVCKTISSVMMLNVKQEKIPISSLLDILVRFRFICIFINNVFPRCNRIKYILHVALV